MLTAESEEFISQTGSIPKTSFHQSSSSSCLSPESHKASEDDQKFDFLAYLPFYEQESLAEFYNSWSNPHDLLAINNSNIFFENGIKSRKT